MTGANAPFPFFWQNIYPCLAFNKKYIIIFTPAYHLLSFHLCSVNPDSKYGPTGLFTPFSFDHLDISQDLKSLLADTANHSVTRKTWSSYKSSVNKLNQFAEETQTQVSFPLSDKISLAFTAWLLHSGVCAGTINTYLSGLKKFQHTLGLNTCSLRDPLINTTLKGKTNQENALKLNGLTSTRLPMTPTLLKAWKLELGNSSLDRLDKRLIWAVSTLAFSGGFRGGELLPKEAHSFDPLTSLLGKHIALMPLNLGNEILDIIQVKLRAEKQNKSNKPTVIDIYPSNGPLCPVNALKKWLQVAGEMPLDLPAFRRGNGSFLTQSFINSLMKTLLSKHLEGINGSISFHSLRIGLASCLGSMGFSEQQIMCSGRWSSNAYTAYLKLPRTQRAEVARAIGNLQL